MAAGWSINRSLGYFRFEFHFIKNRLSIDFWLSTKVQCLKIYQKPTKIVHNLPNFISISKTWLGLGTIGKKRLVKNHCLSLVHRLGITNSPIKKTGHSQIFYHFYYRNNEEKKILGHGCYFSIKSPYKKFYSNRKGVR